MICFRPTDHCALLIAWYQVISAWLASKLFTHLSCNRSTHAHKLMGFSDMCLYDFISRFIVRNTTSNFQNMYATYIFNYTKYICHINSGIASLRYRKGLTVNILVWNISFSWSQRWTMTLTFPFNCISII